MSALVTLAPNDLPTYRNVVQYIQLIEVKYSKSVQSRGLKLVQAELINVWKRVQPKLRQKKMQAVLGSLYKAGVYIVGLSPDSFKRVGRRKVGDTKGGNKNGE